MPHWQKPSRAIVVFALTCLFFSVVFRLLPLLNHEDRLLKQWPTEDGYLMLTISRNIGLGHGMTTAAGTIPTNGTQPLCTFLWAGCYALTGGDKTLGVLSVLILSLAIGSVAAYLLYQVGRTVLHDCPDREPIAIVAAGLWFLAPNTAMHTMNCLETGTVTALFLVAILAYVTLWHTMPSWPATQCLLLGLLLGVSFWARIDAALFIAAVCAVRLVGWLPPPYVRSLRKRATEVLLIGTTSVAIGAPWLIHNQLWFGSIMPISGTAQSHGAAFAENLVGIPAVLAEYVTVVGQIPSSVERNPVVIGASIVLVSAVITLATLGWSKITFGTRLAIAFTGAWGLLLAGWYGLLFGADHFLSRYCFPLSPLLALLSVIALWRTAARLRPWSTASLRVAVLVLLSVVAIGLNVRIYAHGTDHGHFQVVNWVEANVANDTWVGAIQTGTLGYFHDRTINLDGKVNPHALQAKMDKAVPQYVVASSIEYLVDWAGLATWHDRIPIIADHFDVIVRDKTANLAVLQRVGPTKQMTSQPEP